MLSFWLFGSAYLNLVGLWVTYTTTHQLTTLTYMYAVYDLGLQEEITAYREVLQACISKLCASGNARRNSAIAVANCSPRPTALVSVRLPVVGQATHLFWFMLALVLCQCVRPFPVISRLQVLAYLCRDHLLFIVQICAGT